MGYNFDEYFRRFIQYFKQILKDPNTDHPLKHMFTEEDLDRLAENPPSMEDVQKFLQHIFKGNPNVNPFSGMTPNFNIPPTPSSSKPSSKKNGSKKTNLDPSLLIDTFEFEDEVHVLIGTNRTDLEFKTGVKKKDPENIALIIRRKGGKIIQVVKLPATVDKKSKQITYQNGTYEIVYKKTNNL